MYTTSLLAPRHSGSYASYTTDRVRVNTAGT